MGNSISLALILFVAALAFKTFPPSKVNWIYGYRTPFAMKNQDIWKDANKLCSNFLLIFSIIFIVFTISFSYIFSHKNATQILNIILVVGLGLTILLTELKLRKIYDRDGHKKEKSSNDL